MKQRFGNTLTSISGGIVMMAMVGLIVGAIGVVVAYKHDTLTRSIPWMILLFLAPPAAFTLACLPTLAFSIQIEGQRVRHVMFDRVILSDLPVAAFKKLETAVGPFGAVIYFEDGSVIRFIGAHLGILSALEKELQNLKKAR